MDGFKMFHGTANSGLLWLEILYGLPLADFKYQSNSKDLADLADSDSSTSKYLIFMKQQSWK